MQFRPGNLISKQLKVFILNLKCNLNPMKYVVPCHCLGRECAVPNFSVHLFRRINRAT